MVTVLALAIPVVVVCRDDEDGVEGEGVRVSFGHAGELGAVVARVIRNGFDAPFGRVKVVAGGPTQVGLLGEAFASLGVSYGELPDVTPEESAMLVADFIVKNFDAQLVLEMLQGKLAKSMDGVER